VRTFKLMVGSAKRSYRIPEETIREDADLTIGRAWPGPDPDVDVPGHL